MDGLAWRHEPTIDRWAFLATGRRGSVTRPEPPAPEANDATDDAASLIVAIAVAHDRAAFALLFARYAPRVKAYLIRRGASAQRAEDLAQEALLKVWRKAAGFDPARAGAGAWIFTIARNLQIDAYRRDRAPEAWALDPSETPDPPAEPDSRLVGADRDRRLSEAVRDLPPDQLAVVRLSFFSDKPHAEIAEALGLPLGTVKSRLRLALNRLRASLGVSSPEDLL